MKKLDVDLSIDNSQKITISNEEDIDYVKNVTKYHDKLSDQLDDIFKEYEDVIKLYKHNVCKDNLEDDNKISDDAEHNLKHKIR